jgi:hypothetical protein
MSERARILPFNSSAFVGRAPLMVVPQTGDRLHPVLARIGAGLKIGFPSLDNSRHRHSCTIADSLADTSAYVCLRVPAPRAPRSSSRRPFHNTPPVSHPHTHACTSSSCPATTPGARPLHALPTCRSRHHSARLLLLHAIAGFVGPGLAAPFPYAPPRRASTCIRCCSTPAEPLARAPTAPPTPSARALH